MGYGPRKSFDTFDAEDAIISLGIGCIVAGVGWRHDIPLALIVLGVFVLLLGIVSLWRRS